jgi:uncharacterized protein (TIGR02118 family)
MIKGMSLLKRKPGLTLEEFARHYEEVHVSLALAHFPFKRYVRNYVTKAEDAEEPWFDCITEVWFETIEDCQAAAEFSFSEAYKVIAEDEERFMDRSRIVAFLVDERT